MQIVRNDLFGLKHKNGSFNFDSFFKEFYPWLKETNESKSFLLCLTNEEYYKIEKTMEDVLLVSSFASEFFKNKNETKHWLVKPNDNLKGYSPIDACISGDVDKVLGLIKKLGK